MVVTASLASAQATRNQLALIAPVAPPIAPPSICNLCTSGGTTLPSDNTVTIAPGSTTTCADVESIAQGLESHSVACKLLQETTLQTQCGCLLPPATPYPVCSVCQKQGEVFTNIYGPLDLNTSSINSAISFEFFACFSIEYFGSINSIEPTACSQLHQAGISTMCGCQTFHTGQSTCQAASNLAVGETTFVAIPATTAASNFNSSNAPCPIDSESVWFRFTGTGGNLTVDACGYLNDIFFPKLLVFTGCDQRTCVVGNADTGCHFTFLSKAGQVYSAAVSGYDGSAGNVELTLRDHNTDPPTVAPTAYPTSAPSASPTKAPRPTRSPAPTSTPTQSPTATRFPSCNICKSSDERISRSESSVCRDVEYNGLTGRIEPATCSILTELNLAETCGCIKPTGNDLCDGAAPISIGVTLNGTAAGSTWEGKVTCPADDYYSPGVWYKFVGNGKSLKINTCEYSDSLTNLTIYTGNNCNQLSCVESAKIYPQSCGYGTQVAFDSKVGVTYFVNVRSNGNFALTLADATPPANDLCPSATIIMPGVRTYGNRTDATSEAVPTCGNVNYVSQGGVWYKYKSSPQPSRIVTEDYCSYENADQGGVSVFSGSCDSLVCVAGNQHYCSSNKGRIVWESEKETTYFILVFGSELLPIQTDFNLKLTEVAASPTASPVPSMTPIALVIADYLPPPTSRPLSFKSSPPVFNPSISGVTSQPTRSSPAPSTMPRAIIVVDPLPPPSSRPISFKSSPPVFRPSISGVTPQPTRYLSFSSSSQYPSPNAPQQTSQPTRYLSFSSSSQYPSPNVPQHVPYIRTKKSASKKTSSRKSAKKLDYEKKGGEKKGGKEKR